MFAEDLSQFLDAADFGTEAVLNDGERFNCIFDADYVEALGMASSGPQALCRSIDVAGAKRDDRFEVAGSLFRVVNIEQDGTGMTVVRLARA